MMMSDYELKRTWRNRGLNDKAMIKCLCELNCCGEVEMIAYLESIGIEIGDKVKNKLYKRKYLNPWSQEEERILFEKRALGYSYQDIAQLVGRSKNACLCHFNEYVRKQKYVESCSSAT